MSKWHLLALSVIAVIVAAHFYRSVETIRRSGVRDPALDEKLKHLPPRERKERSEWARMYIPERGLLMAVGIAIGLIVATVRAFLE